MSVRSFLPIGVAGLAMAAPARANIDPWADTWRDYTPGIGAGAGYQDPTRALGEPTRISGEAFEFPSVVSPFAAPWEGTDLVTIGRGGSLTVAFDEPVTNDSANPYGLDLLIFGNSFYTDNGGTAGELFSGGGHVEVSADGLTWIPVPAFEADGRFPTLAYADLLDPYSAVPGAVLSDFTRPVNPAFNPVGKTFAEIVAGYDGSGGGAGIDIGALGLTSISFVRIWNSDSDMLSTQIDGLADVSPVPAPGFLTIAGAWTLLACRRRR